MNEDDRAAFFARYYDRRTADIVARLRDLVGDVERASEVRPNLKDLAPDFVSSAASIQHAVLWGLANLSLDGLTRAAAEAHMAVRTPEDAS